MVSVRRLCVFIEILDLDMFKITSLVLTRVSIDED